MPKYVRDLLASWWVGRSRSKIKELWNSIPHCVFRCIWWERNSRSFEGKERHLLNGWFFVPCWNGQMPWAWHLFPLFFIFWIIVLCNSFELCPQHTSCVLGHFSFFWCNKMFYYLKKKSLLLIKKIIIRNYKQFKILISSQFSMYVQFWKVWILEMTLFKCCCLDMRVGLLGQPRQSLWDRGRGFLWMLLLSSPSPSMSLVSYALHLSMEKMTGYMLQIFSLKCGS